MHNLVATNQTRIRRKINVTPEILKSIAHQLSESSKFATRGEVVQLDVTNGDFILTLEYTPEVRPTLSTSFSSDDDFKHTIEPKKIKLPEKSLQ